MNLLWQDVQLPLIPTDFISCPFMEAVYPAAGLPFAVENWP
jgi:hypothetical protein